MSTPIDPDDPVLWTGPALTKKGVAEYLNVSVRQVDLFEESGDLIFATIGSRMKRTTVGQCDRLMRRGLQALLNGADAQK